MNAVVFPEDAVVKAGLPVAVGVDQPVRPVFLRHAGEDAVPLEDACGGIMQEHDEAAKARFFVTS